MQMNNFYLKQGVLAELEVAAGAVSAVDIRLLIKIPWMIIWQCPHERGGSLVLSGLFRVESMGGPAYAKRRGLRLRFEIGDRLRNSSWTTC